MRTTVAPKSAPSPASQPRRLPRPSRDALVFAAISAVTLAAATAGLAALWPVTLAAARAQSASLTAAGHQASGGEALVNYQLATWLDPHNAAAFAGLARAQILAGYPDDALASLARAGQGSETGQLKVRTLIELGRYNQAANEAAPLTAPGRPDADLTLAGLSFALAGRPASDLDLLMARVTAPEALQELRRAQTSDIPLAAELYATGLLRSSSAMLTRLPASYERDLLLARIALARHTPDALAQATTSLETAITANPASLEARTMLAQVYRNLDRTTAANEQDIAIAKLKAGRP